MSPPTVVWTRHSAVLWRRSGSVLVLTVPGTEELVTLDRTGLDLWQELEQPSTLSSIAARLGERYGFSSSRVAEDIERVLEELEHRRLVHRSA